MERQSSSRLGALEKLKSFRGIEKQRSFKFLSMERQQSFKERRSRDSPGKRGDSPLHLAARAGNVAHVQRIFTDCDPELVGELAAHQNQDGETALYVAAEKGHVDVVCEILKVCDVQSAGLKATNSFDAFHIATKQGHLDVLQELLQAFPPLAMTTNSTNATALATAAIQGHIAIVNLLLETDAGLTKIVRNSGKTALHSAARMGHVEVVASLLNKDPGIGFRTDKKGQTALHMASKGQSAEVLLELLKSDVSVIHLEDNKGNRPLHVATRKGNTTMVQTLISIEEIDINAVNRAGETAFAIAEERGNEELVNILRKVGGVHVNPPKSDIQWQIKKTHRTKMHFHKIKKRIRKLHTETPVCALADAMFRLPAKLDGLLATQGHTLSRGTEDEIPLIRQDMEKMVAILQQHNDSGGTEDRVMTAKCLAKEVRELSYDIEDSVDQYKHAAGTRRWILSPHSKKYKITRRRGMTATARLPEKLWWRLWMANKIREFSMRSQEALQRHSLFNHLGGTGISASAARSDDSWHPTPIWEPVGIYEHVKKLEAWLAKDGEKELKVVSVVGPGGIGKTTLANELYRRIRGQFECRAYVRTSRKPDVRKLLISMLSQVRPHQPPDSWKMHSLIANIRTHLQDKRYLIIIDDIWATSTWDIVNRALPDSNLRSGILITTEIEDVALKCCGYDSKYVFPMKPLGEDDSRKLFFNAAFGSEHACPTELSEVSNNIIRKCGGLPLATVTVASLLVSQMGKPEQWEYVDKSLGYGLRSNPTSEGMKQVINLSYNNLSQYLKACVMYLSIYQEDYIIQKEDLVNQWMAEGFIRARKQKDQKKLSRSCFDELITRRMIQPVHVNDNDDVLSCSVHYMVLDFVTHKSIEENFVTAIDQYQTTARLADKVRRLSLHFGNAEATSPTNMRLSQVRTLAYFGVFQCLPSIMDFGLLQVLILHLWGNEESTSFDLTRISVLFRLRYLHVTCNATLEIPQIQMRGLQYLETLKIDARVSAIPSDIVHLPGLLHLSLPVETNLPNGIACMTSLCTLGYFDLSVNSIENVQSLGELTNLRDLRLTCSTVPSFYLKNKMDNMSSIFAKLSKLRSVSLEPSSILDSRRSRMSISCDGLSSVSSPPVLLRRFEWLPHICTFSSLPKWIGHLRKLCILKIGVRELVSNDVDVLGGLPALTVLSLYVRTKPAKRIIFSKAGFSVLKYFKFRCRVPWLEFEADAMSNLRKLKLSFDAHGADQHGTIPVGIVHLSGLEEISAKIGGAGADNPDRRAAESALIYAIKMHPARPTFNIQCLDGMFSGEDDTNSGVQEEEHMTQQKQYEIMEEDSIEQQEVLRKGTRDDAQRRFSAFSEWRTVADKHAGSSTHPPSRMGEKTELPSSRRWTTWLKTEALKYKIVEEDSNRQPPVLQKDYMDDANKHAHGRVQEEEHMTLQKQNEIMVEDSVEQHEVLQNDSMEGANKNVHGSSATLMQSPLSPVEIHPYPALTAGDMMKLGITAEQAAGCAIDAAVAGLQMSSTPNSGAIKRRKNQARKVMCIPAPTTAGLIPIPSDLWAWRKYGQKPIKGSPHSRGYYRCSSTKGCSARKQVERSRTDPSMLVITYTSEHNHPSPTQRNALAGSTQSHHGKNGSGGSGSGSKSSHNEKHPQPNDVNEERKDHQTATTTTTTTSTVTTTASTSPMIVKEETLTLGGSSDQALPRDQISMNTAAGDHSQSYWPIMLVAGQPEDILSVHHED